MGNASGVYTLQSIRRRSADDRYDRNFDVSHGVPWDPQATKLDEAPLPRIVEGDQQPLTSPNLFWTNTDPLLDAQHVAPPELATEALESNTLQCAERGWIVCFNQKRAVCV